MAAFFDFFQSSRATATIFVLIGIIITFLCLAFLLDFLRRFAQKLQKRRESWRQLRRLVAEKELNRAEQTLLEKLLRKHAPDDPYEAATLRQQFDACVTAEMNALHTGNDTSAYARMGLRLRDLRRDLGLDYIPFGQPIHSTRELYNGQAIWIAKEPLAPNPPWHATRVTDTDEAYFTLAPQEAALLPALSPGDTLRCRMWREEDARYVFPATLARVDNNPPAWIMLHTDRLERTQSREHYRIRHDESLSIELISAPMDHHYDDLAARPVIARLRGRTTSLSAGGIALIVQQPLPEQVFLRLALELENGHPPLSITARIVGATPLAAGRYLLRAAYVAIPEESREQIAHYVFARQHPRQRRMDEHAQEPL